MVGVTLKRVDVKDFLWDYGICLPFPLRLGPVGPVGVHPQWARSDVSVFNDRPRLLRTWGRDTAAALSELAKAVRSCSTTVYVHAVTNDSGEPESQLTAVALTGADTVVVIADQPQDVKVAVVPWQDTENTLMQFMPSATPWPFNPVRVRAAELQRACREAAAGAPPRTVARMFTQCGMPPELYRDVVDIGERAEVRGFLGAAREDAHGHQPSALSADFVTSPRGGFIRSVQGPEITFAPLTAAVVSRLLRTCPGTVPRTMPQRG
ncbi:hypothetical protein KEM60_00439 [Austwickia sp. TVS 96-490-7B]|uniref:ESX secretion-associated protein EspG n=1 Tax=Austwickia sp. TVS 96-490-7B TaxID=2830843 RepID=UPI001C5610D2|nr:ESX secretion-associated protein EspG [Austwickia sp. TVS 96-490-7B]MBW3084252.1 hypothetical protein [Austwickia sp. TVS 96-490-7B]